MLHNLFTAPQRKRLRTEYRLRLATVALSVLTTAVVLGSIALLPTYTYVQRQLKTVQEEEATYRNADGAEATVARDTLRFAALSVDQLREVLEVEQATALIDAVHEVQPAGVTLTGYRYTSEAHELTIEGVAAERGDLISYIEQLEQHVRFTDVPTPIGNLARSADLPFSLTFPVVPTEQVQQ